MREPGYYWAATWIARGCRSDRMCARGATRWDSWDLETSLVWLARLTRLAFCQANTGRLSPLEATLQSIGPSWSCVKAIYCSCVDVFALSSFKTDAECLAATARSSKLKMPKCTRNFTLDLVADITITPLPDSCGHSMIYAMPLKSTSTSPSSCTSSYHGIVRHTVYPIAAPCRSLPYSRESRPSRPISSDP